MKSNICTKKHIGHMGTLKKNNKINIFVPLANFKNSALSIFLKVPHMPLFYGIHFLPFPIRGKHYFELVFIPLYFLHCFWRMDVIVNILFSFRFVKVYIYMKSYCLYSFSVCFIHSALGVWYSFMLIHVDV